MKASSFDGLRMRLSLELSETDHVRRLQNGLILSLSKDEAEYA
jgi:hypothetical protein